MFYKSIVLCLIVYVNTADSAYLGVQLAAEKPLEMAHLDGCYIPNLGMVLPYNMPFSPQDGESCLQYNCHEDNVTSIHNCGALIIGVGCAIIPGDKTLPYPNCCDQPTCDDFIIH